MDLDRHSSSTPSSAGNSRRPISPCGMERKPLKRKMQVVRLCVVVVVLRFLYFIFLQTAYRPSTSTAHSAYFHAPSLPLRLHRRPLSCCISDCSVVFWPNLCLILALPFPLRLYLCPSVSAPPTGPASVHFSAQPVPHPRGGLPSFGNLVHTAGRGVLRVAAGRQPQAGHQAQRQTVHPGWTLCLFKSSKLTEMGSN